MTSLSFRTVSDSAWRFLVCVAALAVLWLGITYFSGVTVPVAVALLLTALLTPLARWLRARRLPPVAATLIAMGAVVVFIGGVGALIGASVVRQWGQLKDQFIAAADTFLGWLAQGPLKVDQAALDGYVAQLTAWLNASTSELAGWAAQAGVGVGHFAAGGAIAVISTFFFLTSGRGIWQALSRVVPAAPRPRVDHAALAGWEALQAYMRAQVIVALIDAVGIFLGAVILRIPLAFALLAFTFVTAFIPVIGAILAGFLAAMLGLVSGGWVTALIMIGVAVLVVQLEGHFLQPLFLGKAAKLHPLAVLLGLAVGATIAGIVGALLVIPVLAFSVAFLKSALAQPAADGSGPAVTPVVRDDADAGAEVSSGAKTGDDANARRAKVSSSPEAGDDASP